MTILNFTKMHALGNDFMIIDNTKSSINLSLDDIVFFANRNKGVGFDQLLMVGRPSSSSIDFNCSIFNADGSRVYQCGNGIRCFASFVFYKKLTNKKYIKISIGDVEVNVSIKSKNVAVIDMGIPIFNPTEVPFLSASVDINYHLLGYKFGVCSLGNPHASIIVDNVDDIDVDKIGKLFTNDKHFPKQVNVSFMQIISKNEIKLRVYERGVGETLACGSGCCAAVIYGIRTKKLVKKNVIAHLPGGDLQVSYDGGSVFLEGETVFVYEANINKPS